MWKLFTSLALLVVATNLAAADEGKKARIGFLSWWPPTSLGLADEFRAALRPLGWVEGRNIEIEVHFTDGDRARTQAVAREFIETGVDVIVAQTTPAIHIAKEATQTIPIVMAPVADPIATGLVIKRVASGGEPYRPIRIYPGPGRKAARLAARDPAGSALGRFPRFPQ
jgi:putative tryptophan/tyrosine transport system substrate-binding protein